MAAPGGFRATPAHASPLSRRLRSHMPCPFATCLRPPSPPPRRSVERPRVPLRYLEAPPKGSPGRRRSIGLTIETDVSWPPRRPTTTSDEFGGEEGDAPPLPALTRPMRAPALTLCVCVPQVEGFRASSSTSRRHPRRHLPPEPRCATDTVLHDLARPRTRTRRSIGGRPSPAPNTAPGTCQSAARRAAVGGWAGRWAARRRQGCWLGSWEGVSGGGGVARSTAAAPCACPCTCPLAGVQAGRVRMD